MPTIFSRLRSAFAPGTAPVRPETKASRTGPLIALSAQGRAVWSPRDYGGFAREGFQTNPVAHRAVRLLADCAASVPLDVTSPDAEAALAVAALLARPNPRQAGQELMEALYMHLAIAGNAYLECVVLYGAPKELHALRPDRMRVVPGASGWPEAYDYVAGGRSVRFMAGGEGPSPSCTCCIITRPTITMACRAWRRRRLPSTSTTRRHAGTRRSWTMRHGRPARWSMPGTAQT